MSITYKFSSKPEFDLKTSKVTLTFEDFYKIMQLAQEHLSCPTRNSGAHLETPKGANQQFYIDKLIVGFTMQSIHFGPGQQLVNQQAQLNASFASALSTIGQISNILKTTIGRSLGNTPLQCLSPRLTNFKSASLIFSTRTFMPKTAVAKDFHKACDNVPNVLVIIKSGQYIAGGFTALAFESPQSERFKPDPTMSTFVFSLNRQKVYPLKVKERAIWCNKDYGPVFGYCGLCIFDDYVNGQNGECVSWKESSFSDPAAVEGEMFATLFFVVDEYEVFRLA